MTRNLPRTSVPQRAPVLIMTHRGPAPVADGPIFILLLCAITAPAQAQFDVALHGDQIIESTTYGVGATFLVPINEYAYDVALGGEYFFAANDTTEAWFVNMDAHTNLFVIRFIRPYTGLGLGYYHRDGRDRVGLNLKGGVYIHVWDRVVPYVQYTYRTIPSIDPSHLQFGLRFLLRRQ